MSAVISRCFRSQKISRQNALLALFQWVVVPILVLLLYFNAKFLLENHAEQIEVQSETMHASLSQHLTQSLAYFVSMAIQIERFDLEELRQQTAQRYLQNQMQAKAIRFISHEKKTLWLVSHLSKAEFLPEAEIFRPVRYFNRVLLNDAHPPTQAALSPSDSSLIPICRPYVDSPGNSRIHTIECQVTVQTSKGSHGALSVIYTARSILSVNPEYKKHYEKYHIDNGDEINSQTLPNSSNHQSKYHADIYANHKDPHLEHKSLFATFFSTHLPLKLLPSTTVIHLVLHHANYYRDIIPLALGGISLVIAFLCVWFFWVRLFMQKRRKMYKRRIHSEKMRLDTLIHASIQGILVHRRQHILYVNQSFIEMFGLQGTQKIEGMPLSKVFPGSHEALFKVEPNDTTSTNRGQNKQDKVKESWGTGKHGHKVWVEGKTLPIRWGKGKAFVTTLMNITHRKHYEVEMLSQKRLLQTVIDNLPFWISLKNGTGQFQFINRAFCESIGIDKEAFLNRANRCNNATNSLPAALQEITAMDQQVIEKKVAMESEWEVKIPGQPTTIRHIVTIPVLGATNMVESVVCYAQDITQRKASEMALVASEQRYRSLFEATFEGLVMLKGHCILHVNQPFLHMLLNPSSEMSGQSILNFFAPDSHFPPLTKEDPVTHCGEMQLLQSNGDTLNVEVLMRSHEYNGENVRVLAVRDISERKRMEHMIKHFVSMVSHELRTPLTSIRGSLGLLANDVAGALPPKAHKLMFIAKENCERLVRLINDILDVQRMESGSLPFANEPLELRALMQKVVDEMESYATPADVTINLVLPQQECWVHADSDRIAQAVVNLVSNAVKFSNPKGIVTITLCSHKTQCHHAVLVQDEGPGISSSFRERIFTPFAQEDPSDARTKNGVGLGLSITKHIVKQSGGTLNFSNHPQGGAEFSFTLPVLQNTHARIDPNLAKPPPPSLLPPTEREKTLGF